MNKHERKEVVKQLYAGFSRDSTILVGAYLAAYAIIEVVSLVVERKNRKTPEE